MVFAENEAEGRSLYKQIYPISYNYVKKNTDKKITQKFKYGRTKIIMVWMDVIEYEPLYVI